MHQTVPTRKYELAVIFSPTLDDRKVAAALERHLSVIGKEGGTVDKVDIWGRRQLAYPIAKRNEGVYAFVQISALPQTIDEVDRLLNLDETVLRTKVLRAEDAHVVLRRQRGAAQRSAA